MITITEQQVNRHWQHHMQWLIGQQATILYTRSNELVVKVNGSTFVIYK